MQLHPTRIAVDLTLTAMVVLGLGVFTEQGAVVAWGGALLLGLMIARAVTLLAVARVRSAGFEMLWQQDARVARIGVGQTLELQAQVRNRDDRAARYIGLRSLHSPHLTVELEPVAGEVPAGGRLAVTVRVTAKRVGRHGLYGLSLEVRGGPGLYEVPLTFSNPFGVEVLPAVYATLARPARGGRSRSHAEAGKPGQQPRGHYDLREVRQYVAGDPFKRIAWKASARRGTLMVREFEQEERDVIWFVLDASVELWAGLSGKAPLDAAIAQLGTLATRHIQQGNRVGLCIVGARRLAWLRPDNTTQHGVRLLEALSFASACYDADRSGFDEQELALRVLEHLRPLDPAAQGLHPQDLDRVAAHAHTASARAPFAPPAPVAATAREQQLRRYLLAFGLDCPARLEPDRPRTDPLLLRELAELLRDKPRANQVVICSPIPDIESQAALLAGLAALRHREVQLCWLPQALSAGLEDAPAALRKPVQFALNLALSTRERGGQRALSQAGIVVLAPARRRLAVRAAPAADAEAEAKNEPLPAQPATDQDSAA